jgi:glycerol-3-phosphate O-acyltransferase
MADLSGLDRLWLGLLRAPLSWWARPHVLPDDLRRRYAQHDRPICYVLNVLGVADLIALEKACCAARPAGAARRSEAAAA